MFPTIRLLDERDAAQWRELRLRALTDDPSAFLATYDEDARISEQEIARRLGARAPGSGVLGGFDDGILVGCVGVARHDRVKTRQRAILWGMHVAPQARRRGLGAALVVRAIELAREAPELEELELNVTEPSHAARRLYLRHGFVAIAHRARATKQGDAYVAEDTLVLSLRGPS